MKKVSVKLVVKTIVIFNEKMINPGDNPLSIWEN